MLMSAAEGAWTGLQWWPLDVTSKRGGYANKFEHVSSDDHRMSLAQFKQSLPILFPLPAKIRQSHLLTQNSYWVHEKNLPLTFFLLAQKKWYELFVSWVPMSRGDGYVQRGGYVGEYEPRGGYPTMGPSTWCTWC